MSSAMIETFIFDKKFLMTDCKKIGILTIKTIITKCTSVDELTITF